MTAADWAPVIQAITTALVGIIAALAAWAISEFRARTNVQRTDQERAAIYSALQTAAGNLRAQLDQGRIRIGDIRPDSPAVIAQALAALARVPDSATAQKTTPAAAAEIIVGRVPTSPLFPVIAIPGTPLPLLKGIPPP